MLKYSIPYWMDYTIIRQSMQRADILYYRENEYHANSKGSISDLEITNGLISYRIKNI